MAVYVLFNLLFNLEAIKNLSKTVKTQMFINQFDL
jgi:hypothetical protein